MFSSWMTHLRRKPRKNSLQIENLVAGYENRAPSHQNAIDLIPGWTSMFPAELELRAGAGAGFFHDERIRWAIERFGDLAGRNVLELGPLEAAHTTMLVKRARMSTPSKPISSHISNA